MTDAHQEPDGSNIIPFVFEDQLVRIVTVRGEPWFVAKDVCKVLAIKNDSDALDRLEADERDGVGITDPIGREQRTNIISESGLYALVFTSRKEEAKRFRKWVTGEVLPTIRRTGRYGLYEPQMASPSVLSLPVTEMQTKLSLIREARLVFGVAASRRLWDTIGLPCAPEPAYAESNVLGLETLDVILSETTPAGRRVGLVLSAALNGHENARAELNGLGMMVLDDEDGVVFANAVPFLVKIGKKGQFDVMSRLRHITGARPWRRLYYAGMQSRGTLVPISEIEPCLRAVRDVHDQNGFELAV